MGGFKEIDIAMKETAIEIEHLRDLLRAKDEEIAKLKLQLVTTGDLLLSEISDCEYAAPV